MGSDSGCDDRLTWDDRDDTGRTVPPGVYLVRFVGDGITSTKKLLLMGKQRGATVRTARSGG